MTTDEFSDAAEKFNGKPLRFSVEPGWAIDRHDTPATYMGYDDDYVTLHALDSKRRYKVKLERFIDFVHDDDGGCYVITDRDLKNDDVIFI